MRHSPESIRQFLIDQPANGQSVASFCADHDLKVPTFYSWKRKYKQVDGSIESGFCKITPKEELAERSLRLPSGLRVELTGLSISEIAELVLEIDRAHA